MSDRDPTLEDALSEVAWYGKNLRPMASVTREDFEVDVAVLVRTAQDAVYRSLGAVTPEAQTALREVVMAIRAFDKHKTSFGRNQILFAEGAFAALATPPEEGR